ncbi:SoxR reducing system RseC family protein [Christensenellaceae bacterium OttesenSCG-928-M15]|nr:SoxR reducing system RseC family protein [Christensenellaceae bacterium OttesenSCG-928-M15]
MEQMQHMGEVTCLDGDFAVIRFVRSKMCQHCGACIHLGDTDAQVRIKNTLHAQVGDHVRVELRAKYFLQANLLAYILPLALLLVGLYFGSLVSEVLGVALGLLGACSIFLLLKRLEPKFAKSQHFDPHMVDFVDPLEVIAEETH